MGAEAEEARETKPITLIQKAVMDHLFEPVFTVVEKSSWTPCDLMIFCITLRVDRFKTHTKKTLLQTLNARRQTLSGPSGSPRALCLAHREQLHVEEGFGDELLVSSAVLSHDSVCVLVGADDGHNLVTIPLILACNQLGSA